MIGKDENNQVHESDSFCNKEVADLVAAMKILKDTRACIDYVLHGKTIEELREYMEKERMEARASELKREIGYDR